MNLFRIRPHAQKHFRIVMYKYKLNYPDGQQQTTRAQQNIFETKVNKTRGTRHEHASFDDRQCYAPDVYLREQEGLIMSYFISSPLASRYTLFPLE